MVKTAIIVGGSLGGLMTGIMLRNHGYTVTIIEQDPASSQRRSHAAGIAPGPEFLKFMEKYDRTRRPISDGKFPMYIVTKDGSGAKKLPVSFNYSSWGLLNSILRANFDGLITKACPVPPEPIAAKGESIYLTGKRVTGVQFKSKEVSIQCIDALSQNEEIFTSDLIIAADGTSSTIRNVLFPEVKRHYSGIVSWRGTVPEDQVSEATRDYFDKSAKFFKHLPRGYMLVYKMPSDDGDISVGGRVINWIWYQIMPAGSDMLREAMTDINGREHYNTVPRDLLQPCAWENQKSIGLKYLPGPFSELLEQTKTTFITKINDIASVEAVVKDKLFFVGDALNTIRPHIAQGTNQAAYHCLLLDDVIAGKAKASDWGDQVTQQGRMTAAMSTLVGLYGLRKWAALPTTVLKVLALLFTMKFRALLNKISGQRQIGTSSQ